MISKVVFTSLCPDLEPWECSTFGDIWKVFWAQKQSREPLTGPLENGGLGVASTSIFGHCCMLSYVVGLTWHYTSCLKFSDSGEKVVMARE